MGQNFRCKGLNCSEENIGEELQDTGFCNGFVHMTPKTYHKRINIDEWDFIKKNSTLKGTRNGKTTTQRMVEDFIYLIRD